MEQKYILGWMFDYFWYHNIGLKDVLDYFSLWIAGIEGKLLKSPEQVRPSQVYPVRHVHTCDPMVLVQFKFTWQERFLAHSSMSEKLLAFNHNSWCMIHVYTFLFWTLSAIIIVRELLVALFYERESWSARMFSILWSCFQVGLRIFIFYHW